MGTRKEINMSKNRSRPSKSDQCSCSSQSSSHHNRHCKTIHQQQLNRVTNWQMENDENDRLVSDIYDHAYRQQALSQTLSLQNGQRLFTAMSDPSVCNYPTMPMTYTMEPMSLPPIYRVYPSIAPNLHFRSTKSGGCRRSISQSCRVPIINPSVFTNGSKSLRENSPCQTAGSPLCSQSDYTSLPPTAGMDCKNSKKELNSEQRRYSDPGLGPADTQIEEKSDNESDEESRSSITTISESNKLVVTLIEQMTALKELNSQLFKELHQTKEDLQNVKTELGRLKQNTSFNYQPGTLSEIIRELREASRVREETMMSRVKSLLDDHISSKSSEIENLKSQVENLSKTKSDSDKRIVHLEEELAALKLNASTLNQREIAAFEEETLALRRELQEARARMAVEKHQYSVEKIEKLIRKLRGKMNACGTERRKKVVVAAATEATTVSLEDLESDDSDSLTDDDSSTISKSNSTNDSSNSLSGPVTDL